MIYTAWLSVDCTVCTRYDWSERLLHSWPRICGKIIKISFWFLLELMLLICLYIYCGTADMLDCAIATVFHDLLNSDTVRQKNKWFVSKLLGAFEKSLRDWFSESRVLFICKLCDKQFQNFSKFWKKSWILGPQK